MQLTGIGALVTGAASGMGRATAGALAAAGAKVALLDVNANAVGTAAREVGGHACVCDMQDPRQIERGVAAAIEACGPLRILVSCAGVGRMEPLVGPDAVPFALLAHTLQVNLIGTLQVVQLFAADLVRRERLEEGERGVVVMVASGAAFDGPMASSAYTASKGGIVSMTLALARELGDHGVRVNTISPGAFVSAMPWRAARPERGSTSPAQPSGIATAMPVPTLTLSPGPIVAGSLARRSQPASWS